MRKKFYIIPGWKETCRRRQYQSLAKAVKKVGYDPVFQKVDWSKKISEQIFEVEKDSILLGFSMGAILARLVAQNYKNQLVIFASMTPLRHFEGGEQEDMMIDAIGKKTVEDVKKNLKTKIKSKSILIYGDKEEEPADLIIPNTGHEISENYIRKVIKIIKNI